MITTTTPHNTTSPQLTSTFWFSGNICAVLVLVRPKLKDCFHQVIIDEGFLTFQHNSNHLATFASVFKFSEIRLGRLKKFRATDLSFQLLIALAFFDTLYIICGGINYTFRFLYMKVNTFNLIQTQNQYCQGISVFILLSGPLRRWFLLTVRTLTKSPTRYKSDIYNVVSQKKRSSLLPASHSSLPQRGFVRNYFYDGRNLYRKVVHGIFSSLLVL